jgi:cysteine desulfurase
MRKIYLDHNATTPVHPEVRKAMMPFLTRGFGNPSSPHWAGREVSGHIDTAREQVASLINSSPTEVIFTCGGSEGDNMAVKGIVMQRGKGTHVITTAVEHPAVYSTCRLLESSGFGFTFVPVDKTGRVDPDRIRKAIRKKTALISVMYSNNETGVLNPIREISEIAREKGIILHTDAVQAVGKIPVDVKALGVDMLTASGHKFNAPKGVGFQYIRKGLQIPPLISGGHQERGMRAGTENVPGIVALGKASEIAKSEMEKKARTLGRLRDRLERDILRRVPDTEVNGTTEHRIYNTTNISFKNIEGDALLALLDREGIAVSTGSACASESTEPSRILTAMGIEPLCSRGALRFSLGLGTTKEDIDYCLKVLPPLARRLLEMSPFFSG